MRAAVHSVARGAVEQGPGLLRPCIHFSVSFVLHVSAQAVDKRFPDAGDGYTSLKTV